MNFLLIILFQGDLNFIRLLKRLKLSILLLLLLLLRGRKTRRKIELYWNSLCIISLVQGDECVKWVLGLGFGCYFEIIWWNWRSFRRIKLVNLWLFIRLWLKDLIAQGLCKDNFVLELYYQSFFNNWLFFILFLFFGGIYYYYKFYIVN